jgi:hypothetical protein
MFTIDLTLRNTPFPVSVQRKTSEDAEAIYQLILAAMRSGNPDIVELICEGKTEKFLGCKYLRKMVWLLVVLDHLVSLP